MSIGCCCYHVPQKLLQIPKFDGPCTITTCWGIDLKVGEGRESKIGRLVCPPPMPFSWILGILQSTMMPAVPTWLTFVRFIKNNGRYAYPLCITSTPSQFGYSSVKPPMYISTCPKGFSSRRKALLKVVNHVMKLLVDYVNEDIKRVHGNNTP
jgi:hypothetical protein